jgi:hypothetical protein
MRDCFLGLWFRVKVAATTLWWRCRRWCRRKLATLRWAPITAVVMGRINGSACEIEFRDRCGNVIGYWAYGAFDPGLPYREDD